MVTALPSSSATLSVRAVFPPPEMALIPITTVRLLLDKVRPRNRSILLYPLVAIGTHPPALCIVRRTLRLVADVIFRWRFGGTGTA
jgi:hypothetical protein